MPYQQALKRAAFCKLAGKGEVVRTFSSLWPSGTSAAAKHMPVSKMLERAKECHHTVQLPSAVHTLMQ